MNADQFVAARVSSETKARLRLLADRRQISESGLLKQFIELMLQTGDTAAADPICRADAKTARAMRLTIRLRQEDQMLLHERAKARGMAPATYVSVLTRAHLRGLSPLPKEELLAVKRAISELRSIGRNLNQIARVANQGGHVVGAGKEDVRTMLRVCQGLRDYVKALLSANVRAWNQGHAGDE